MIYPHVTESVPLAAVIVPASAEEMFERGMLYSTGREGLADLVTAHMWFNLAAMKGCAEAVRLRREVAAEMADAQIGQAQRAAVASRLSDRIWSSRSVAEPAWLGSAPCQRHSRRAYRFAPERWPSG